jgi:hypothetical protein
MNFLTSLFSAAHKRVPKHARAKRAERQREADAELLLEDLRSGFAGQTALDTFAGRDEYKSAIGEDFEGDL